MIISVYVDDETDRRLRAAAEQTGRPVEDLAEAAVSETALEWHRRQGFKELPA